MLLASPLRTGASTTPFANKTYGVGALRYELYETYNTQPVTVAAATGYCTSGTPVIDMEELTIAAAHAAMLNGSLTCTQLVQAYNQRIAAYDKLSGLNSIIALSPTALSDAAALDQQLMEYMDSGEALPPLFCMPTLVKDLYDFKGLPSTAGAVALEDNFPTQDCTVIKKIKAQGAIIIAKTTMSEWAFSAVHSIGSVFGVVRNPYDLDRSTGGSSGGTAAGMAANLGLMGFGSDTGSSIRTPSAFASLVGIRPSAGLISRAGLVPLDFYRDTAGPIGRTVTDVATTFGALPGYDPLDTLTESIALFNVTIPDNYTQFLVEDGLQGKRIGVMMNLATRPKYDPEVLAVFLKAVQDMEDAGATIVMNVTLEGNSLGDMDFEPDSHFQQWYVGYGEDGHWETVEGKCALWKESLEQYLATAGSHYKRAVDIFYDGLVHPISIDSVQADLVNYNQSNTYPEGYPNVTCGCRAWYEEPCQGEVSARFTDMLDDNELDVVVFPVQNNPPPYIGDWNASFARNTYLSPMTGTPAITVPMGFTTGGLPTGIMIQGRHWDEPTLFTVAYGYEQATKHRMPSPLFPECTTPNYVPLDDVIVASSDEYNYAYAPLASPLVPQQPVTAAGRRLRGLPAHHGFESGREWGESQQTGHDLKYFN
ncbi:hypothetical protein WJX73_000584 [Symbiochloris irregularis]|uniref:Amidase domain-containing protein n=1 Tax=Symbiochloris irregularis TaxID=706552 RepID=A0AAW1NMV2_9CHLO